MDGSRKKINADVGIPVDRWDMSQHILMPQRSQPVYQLFATSNHSGTIRYGHYTAHVRKPGKPSTWYKFNDSTVEEMDAAEVQSKDSYVLFYDQLV